LQSTEHRENNYDQHAKKKQKVLDDVDIFLANKNWTINTTLCTTNRHPPTQGPFWMTPAQRLETKHDQQLGKAKSRAKTKIELLKELRQSGYDTTKQRYLKEDLWLSVAHKTFAPPSKNRK
jgi:hypothetical protein